VNGVTLEWFRSYLSERTQVVGLEGVQSEIMAIECGVPQGSILGPLLFSIYINDITYAVNTSKIVLYADDTAIYFLHASVDVINEVLSDDFRRVADWLEVNKLTLNVKKTNSVLFGTPTMLAKSNSLNLNHGGAVIEQVPSFKYLGITLDENLNFGEHLSDVARKISSRIGVLGRIRNFLSVEHRVMVHNAIVLPYLDYCSTVWSNTCIKYTDPLSSLHRRAARVILGTNRSEEALCDLKWISMTDRWLCQRAVMMYKVTRGLVPEYLSRDLPKIEYENERVTRGQSQGNLRPTASGNEWGRRRLAHHGAYLWNSLPADCKSASSLISFKSHIRILIENNFKFYRLKL